MVAIGFLSLGAIGYLIYRLGAEWFNRPVGLLAAAIVLTRVPMLDFGVRAYVDIPYIALVLAALLIETKRPRAGWPVLALLAVAGLLRPEAWLFSAAYLLYLAYTRAGRPSGSLPPLAALVRPGELLGLTALAAAAPVLWALSDLAFAGDALYSLTGTQDTVDTLGRETGIGGLVTEGPPRLGEVVREPVLVGGALGVVLAFALLRGRARISLAAGVLALGAFSLLALGGLAVITRYLLLTGTIVSIFCAVAVFGWMLLERGDPMASAVDRGRSDRRGALDRVRPRPGGAARRPPSEDRGAGPDSGRSSRADRLWFVCAGLRTRIRPQHASCSDAGAVARSPAVGDRPGHA